VARSEPNWPKCSRGTDVPVDAVCYADGEFTVHVEDRAITASNLLVATGRLPNLPNLGLDTLGIDPNARVVETDERLRAGENLWAVGDITGKGAHTHMSMYQASIVVRDILGQDGPWADYRAATQVTFTSPEIASTGLSEESARKQLRSVVVGTGDLGSRGWIAKEEGLIKVVADAERGVVVGATVIGPSAGEVISMLATAVHARIPVTTLLGTHFAYPTYYRAVETALRELHLDK
jgi:pyruvate/2-oxoglutarate dehydrogenase complex dihydrolipoamide dehydrogenase (E3) component